MHHTPLFYSDSAAQFLLCSGPVYANVFVNEDFNMGTHIFSGAHQTEQTANRRPNMNRKFYGRAKYRLVIRLKEMHDAVSE